MENLFVFSGMFRALVPLNHVMFTVAMGQGCGLSPFLLYDMDRISTCIPDLALLHNFKE